MQLQKRKQQNEPGIFQEYMEVSGWKAVSWNRLATLTCWPTKKRASSPVKFIGAPINPLHSFSVSC